MGIIMTSFFSQKVDLNFHPVDIHKRLTVSESTTTELCRLDFEYLQQKQPDQDQSDKRCGSTTAASIVKQDHNLITETPLPCDAPSLMPRVNSLTENTLEQVQKNELAASTCDQTQMSDGAYGQTQSYELISGAYDQTQIYQQASSAYDQTQRYEVSTNAYDQVNGYEIGVHAYDHIQWNMQDSGAHFDGITISTCHDNEQIGNEELQNNY